MDSPPFSLFPGASLNLLSMIFGNSMKIDKKKFPSLGKRQSNMAKLIFEAQGIARDDIKGRLEHVKLNFKFFNAPIGLFICVDKRMSIGQYPDLGILIGFISLLCEENGLGSIAQIAWSLWNNTLKQLLKMDDNMIVFCGMSIGYKNENDKVNKVITERMSFDEMVTIVNDVKDIGNVKSTLNMKQKMSIAVAVSVLAVAVSGITAAWFGLKKK